MRMKGSLHPVIGGIFLVFAGCQVPPGGSQSTASGPGAGGSDLAGVVTGAKDGKFVILRVPYAMGFYTKGLDGRIGDPGAGWKGRALLSTYATRAPFHVEGRKGTRSKVLKFQPRPDPLAN